MKYKNFFLKIVDSNDSDIEAHLCLLCIGAIVLIGLSIYQVIVLKQAFDQGQFGEGLGLLLAGGGAAAWGQGLQRTHMKSYTKFQYKKREKENELHKRK